VFLNVFVDLAAVYMWAVVWTNQRRPGSTASDQSRSTGVQTPPVSQRWLAMRPEWASTVPFTSLFHADWRLFLHSRVWLGYRPHLSINADPSMRQFESFIHTYPCTHVLQSVFI